MVGKHVDNGNWMDDRVNMQSWREAPTGTYTTALTFQSQKIAHERAELEWPWRNKQLGQKANVAIKIEPSTVPTAETKQVDKG